MKKLVYIFSIAFLMLLSCSQNENPDNPEDYKASILGKWNLISDTYGTENNPVEDITSCQLAFWQFDFKNNKDMVFKSTSDDPSLGISQCDPKLLDYTYSINNDLITMTPVNSGYSAFKGFIKSLSSTQLVISSGKDNLNKYRIFTFKKE